jgi:hypothetical protein
MGADAAEEISSCGHHRASSSSSLAKRLSVSLAVAPSSSAAKSTTSASSHAVDAQAGPSECSAAGSRRRRGAGGSPMGRVYRETTPAMMAQVTAALDDRNSRAQAVAAYLLREGRDSWAVEGGEGR